MTLLDFVFQSFWTFVGSSMILGALLSTLCYLSRCFVVLVRGRKEP